MAPSATRASTGLNPSRTPTSREEAAQAFEAHLVRQMVDVMFAGVFDGESGQGGGGIAAIGQDSQKEVVVNELTTLLTSKGGLGLADAMLKQWSVKYGEEHGSEAEQVATTASAPTIDNEAR